MCRHKMHKNEETKRRTFIQHSIPSFLLLFLLYLLHPLSLSSTFFFLSILSILLYSALLYYTILYPIIFYSYSTLILIFPFTFIYIYINYI
ncbi:hypothetical protein F4703DRAFT_1887319 [Phycomyces blakesleeanus]